MAPHTAAAQAPSARLERKLSSRIAARVPSKRSRTISHQQQPPATLESTRAPPTSNAATAASHPAPSPLPPQPAVQLPSAPSVPDPPNAAAELPSGSIEPRMVAAAAAMAALVTATPLVYQALQSTSLPPIQDALAAAAVAVGVAGVTLKSRYGQDIHLEYHKGRLYLQLGLPSSGPLVAPGSITTLPTGDVRGNGAYATRLIPKGTWLGDYDGELLHVAAFDARYPDGVGDYAMAVAADHIMDAAHLAADTSKFHPVHMNHSRTRANVVRYYQRSQRRVSFLTCRDVQLGEELLYDYGAQYWRGREHLELP